MENEGDTKSETQRAREEKGPTDEASTDCEEDGDIMEEEVRQPKMHEWIIEQVCEERKNKKIYYMAFIIEVSPTLKVCLLKHVFGTTNTFLNSNR